MVLQNCYTHYLVIIKSHEFPSIGKLNIKNEEIYAKQIK